MLETMRRLHPRGAANRGICVDRDGAMLGPACVLVERTPSGFRGIDREDALVVQKYAFDGGCDADWLFRQSQRIADALNKGEVALAQIYGLRIPIRDLDDRLLKRLGTERFAKWTFNPNEPRIPKGDPHGGEWTTGTDSGTGAPLASPSAASADSDSADGGGGGVPPILQFDAVPADDGLTATDDDSGSGVSSGGSSVRYEWASSQGGNSEGGPATPLPFPDINPQLPSPIAAFAGDQADWLFGDLAPGTAGALARFMTGMTGASIVFGILFIPTDRGIVGQGPITGSPGLSYRYDSEMGTLQVRQDVGSLGSVILTEAHIGSDGLYRDAEGNIVGRYLSGSGFIIDVGASPGYRMLPGSDTAPNGQPQQQNQPKPELCPDDNDEDITGRSERALAYQEQISGLARGLEITLNGVRFDGCREEDGTMLEAKGPGFADKMDGPTDWQGWFTGIAALEDQMRRQNNASDGRTVEWHFAEEPVADFFRAFAVDQKLTNIRVIYTPPRRP